MSIRNDQCKKVCKILDDALANRPSERDALIVAVQKAFDALADDGWIPCEDRLPEEDGQYLITVKYKHVDGYEDIYAEPGEWGDGEWDMFSFGHCGEVESILAWRELPKPPRWCK